MDKCSYRAIQRDRLGEAAAEEKTGVRLKWRKKSDEEKTSDRDLMISCQSIALNF